MQAQDGRVPEARRKAGAGVPRASRRGMTVGVIGAGGGAGATTVLVNVAALAASGGRVLAVELASWFGAFVTQLKVSPRGSTADVLARPESLELELARCVTPYSPGVELLCASQTSEPGARRSGEVLDHLVHAAAGRSDLVLVDLPGYLAAEHERVLRHLDHVLVVLEPHEASLAGARALARRLRGWGLGSARLSAVAVEKLPGAASDPVALAAVCAEMGLRLACVVPAAAEACKSAVRRGVPLVTAHPDIPAARALDVLYRELISELESLRLRAAVVSGSEAHLRRLSSLLDESDPVRFDVTWARDVDQILGELAEGGFDAVLLVQDDPRADLDPVLQRVLGLADRTAILVLGAGGGAGRMKSALDLGAQEHLDLERVDAYWLSHAIRSSIQRRRVLARVEREMRDLVACESELRRLVVQLLREDHADPRMV